MATYTVQDTTMTALGDAVRKQLYGGTEEHFNYTLTYMIDKITLETSLNAPQYKYILYGEISDDTKPIYLTITNVSGIKLITPQNVYNTGFPIELITDYQQLVIIAQSPYSELTFQLEVTVIPLDENGNEFKYTPAEMVDEINGLKIPNISPIVLTGSCPYGCSGVLNTQFINNFGDKISTDKLSDMRYMFFNNQCEYIPFELNLINSTNVDMNSMFSDCSILKELPKINNGYPSGLNYIFYDCYNLRYIPEDYFNDWNFNRIQTYAYSNCSNVFGYCYSLRNIPKHFLNNLWGIQTSATYTPYSRTFTYCVSLNEINGLGVQQSNLKSNTFTDAFNICGRLKDFTFAVNEDGTPKTANWKGQTIDLSVGGWTNTTYKPYILNYNSGITADKEVKDDATYQALKDDPDWFTLDVNYSRYNHDSAVNTINSLPDTSAYLASSGGTNTIKFMGAAGTLTDGGAINTLTEEEIAVATAKGWTVSLV